MRDFILGVLAILGIMIIFAMRESEKKWIAIIGWGIIILAKILR